MSTHPNHEETQVPKYETRTVDLPDGGRFIVAHKPGALDNVSDAELIASHNDFLHAAKNNDAPPLPLVEDADRDNVRNLAQERLLRRTPGAPFTTDELAPLLTDPTNRDGAAQLAAVMNMMQEAFSRNDYKA